MCLAAATLHASYPGTTDMLDTDDKDVAGAAYLADTLPIPHYHYRRSSLLGLHYLPGRDLKYSFAPG